MSQGSFKKGSYGSNVYEYEYEYEFASSFAGSVASSFSEEIKTADKKIKVLGYGINLI